MRTWMTGLGLGLALTMTAASPSFGAEATAIFAGGCFWCTEADFDKVPGVISTTSGYTGGRTANPTYKAISAGNTGHAEAVKVVYDADKITYRQLVDHFWKTIDPTVKDRQFCDTGNQYRTAIFVANATERRVAEETKQQVAGKLKTTIYTEIADAGRFYPAEEYHQDFHTKNPAKYKFYRWNCGRDQRLERLWGKKGES